MWFNRVVCPFKEKLCLQLAEAGLCLRSSQVKLSHLCLRKKERGMGGRALSMCDSSVPDTLIKLHVTLAHTHTSKTRESQRPWKSETDKNNQKEE